jgi:hypothetical protein
LHQFAPLEPITSAEGRRNTQDIVPNILPTPSLSTNRKDFLESFKGLSVHAELQNIMGLGLSGQKI